MSYFQFDCPACRQSLEVDEADRGIEIFCPGCGQRVLAVARPAATGSEHRMWPRRLRRIVLKGGDAAHEAEDFQNQVPPTRPRAGAADSCPPWLTTALAILAACVAAAHFGASSSAATWTLIALAVAACLASFFTGRKSWLQGIACSPTRVVFAVVALGLTAALFLRMAIRGFDLHLVSAALWFLSVAITLRPKAPRGLMIAGIGVWLGGLAAAAIRWLHSPPSDVAATGSVIVFFILVIIPAVALLGAAIAILTPSSPRRPKRTEDDEEPVLTAPSGLPLTMTYGDAQSRRPSYTTSDGGGWLGGAGILIIYVLIRHGPKMWSSLIGSSPPSDVPAAVASKPEAPKVIVPTATVQPPPVKPAPLETQPDDGRLGSPFSSFVKKFGQPTKTYAGGATWDGVGGLRCFIVYGGPSGANEVRYEAEEGYFTFTKACDIVVANSQGYLWSPAVEIAKVNKGLMGMRTIYYWYRSDGGVASFQTTRGAVGDNRAAISYAGSDGDTLIVRGPSSDAAKNIENHRKYSMARDL